MKIIGVSWLWIMVSFVLCVILFGFVVVFVVLFVGMVGGWVVIIFIMEDEFCLIWDNVIYIIVGGIFVILLVNLIFVFRVF